MGRYAPVVVGNRSRDRAVGVGVDAARRIRYLVLAASIGASCTSTPPSLPASPGASQAAPVSARPFALSIETPAGGLKPFGSRMGAIDPLAASTQPSDKLYERIGLAAATGTVTVRFVNALPQSITVLDDTTGSDLYHVSSRFGPGHPQGDQGFVQFFFAPLHADGSQQLVLAYGQCQPVCAGASQVLVISMNAEHGVVVEQLRLDLLTNAVAEARADGLWVTQWSGGQVVSTRHFVWEDSSQVFVERS